MNSYILALLLAAFSAWNAPAVPVRVSLGNWDNPPYAGGGCRADGSDCTIALSIDHFMQDYDASTRYSIVAHEVGHILGLDHASCNPVPNVMGCAGSSDVTDFDRARYQGHINPANRAVMTVAHD